MKNTLEFPQNAREIKAKLGQSANRAVTGHRIKNTISRVMAFSCASMALLFTACSEDTLQTEAPEVSESQKEVALTLAPDPLQPIFMENSSKDATGKRANNAAGPDRGRFNITIQYVVPPTERQRQVFDEAAGRWERIIIKDVPSSEGPLPSAFAGQDSIRGTIDDIIIEVALAPIDGEGGILGQAGPRFVRTDDFLTISGVMFFDVADLAFLEEIDLFEEVIVHEMGHVLGVGTLWNTAQFGFDRTLREGPDSNPYFAGKKANVFWNAEGGEFELPVENMGGAGTRLSHWRESVLDNELMTGFLNLGENPLSRITAGSMRDLGYGSSSVGESYDLPKGTLGVDISELGDEGTPDNPGLNIASREVLLAPIGFVSVK